MASAFHVSSPLDLKNSRRKQQKLIEGLDKSRRHNNNHLGTSSLTLIVQLGQNFKSPFSDWFGPNQNSKFGLHTTRGGTYLFVDCRFGHFFGCRNVAQKCFKHD